MRIGVTASCAKTRSVGLRGFSVVELEYAAKLLMAPHRACSRHCCFGGNELVVQALVRPFLLIVIDKRSDGGPEVPFAEWHHSRQTLGLDGPDKSFGKRVQIRTPGRQQQGRHTTVPQPPLKATV